MGILADRQSQLLIDGKLVAGSAGTFPTVNPATEEVLGVAADASAGGHGPRDRGGPPRFRRNRLVDRHRAAGALHPAVAGGADQPRRRTARDHDRRGRGAGDADVDGAARRSGRRPELLRRHRRVLPVDHRCGCRLPDGHQDPPHDREGGGRRRRRHHAVELPAPDQPRQARAGAGRRQHRRAEARTGHPVVRRGARPTHRRAHRHPARRRQHRHVQRPRRRRAAVQRPTRRHGLVHRVDGDRARRDGRRRGDAEERSSSSSAASRRSSSSTTPISQALLACRRSPRRCTPARGARSPPASWCRVPGTTRPSRRPRRHDGLDQAGRPHRPGHRLRTGDLGPAARPRAELPRLARSTKAARSPAAADVPRTAMPASSSSRPSSRASTTTPRWPARRSSVRC